jgi:hypothetical protein
LGLFRVEVADQLRGAFEIGKEHGHELPFAFEGTPGGQNLLDQMWRCIGQWCAFWGWGRRCCLPTSPHEDTILLVQRQLLGVDEFVLHILQVVVVQLEATFQCPIGHSPFTLE